MEVDTEATRKGTAACNYNKTNISRISNKTFTGFVPRGAEAIILKLPNDLFLLTPSFIVDNRRSCSIQHGDPILAYTFEASFVEGFLLPLD